MIDKGTKCKMNAERVKIHVCDKPEAAERFDHKKFFYVERYEISPEETKDLQTTIELSESKECIYVDVKLCNYDNAYCESVLSISSSLSKTIAPAFFYFTEENELYIKYVIDYSSEIVSTKKIEHATHLINKATRLCYNVMRKAANGKSITCEEQLKLKIASIDTEDEDHISQNFISKKETSESSTNNSDNDDGDDDDTDKDENGNFILPSSIFRRNSFEDEDEGLSILDRINKRMKESKHDELFDRLAAEKENQEE